MHLRLSASALPLLLASAGTGATDGTLVTSFDLDGRVISPVSVGGFPTADYGGAIARSADGRYYFVAGNYDSAAPGDSIRLLAISATTGQVVAEQLYETTIGGIATGEVKDLDVGPDGGLYLAFRTEESINVFRFGACKISYLAFSEQFSVVSAYGVNAQGCTAVDFGTSTIAQDTAAAGVVDDGGRFWMAGDAVVKAGSDFTVGPALVRFTAAGDFDPTFDGDGRKVFDVGARIGGFQALELAGPNRVVAGLNRTDDPQASIESGVMRLVGATPDARFGVGGTRWVTIDPPAGGLPRTLVTDVVIDPLGRTTAVGALASGGTPQSFAFRVDGAGALDPTFSGDGKLRLDSIGVSFTAELGADGRVIVAGSEENPEAALAYRLDENGTLRCGYGGGRSCSFVDGAGSTGGARVRDLIIDAGRAVLVGSAGVPGLAGNDTVVWKLEGDTTFFASGFE